MSIGVQEMNHDTGVSSDTSIAGGNVVLVSRRASSCSVHEVVVVVVAVWLVDAHGTGKSEVSLVVHGVVVSDVQASRVGALRLRLLHSGAC